MNIVVVDYGMGNLRSVTNALAYLGFAGTVSSMPADIRKADKIILPGVGSFGDAMKELRARDLVAPLREHYAANKALLGICLGYQLLFEHSEECPGVTGLGLLRGEVKRFPSVIDGARMKVPHMGWNTLRQTRTDCPVLRGVKDGSFCYFVHSYYVVPADSAVALTMTEYGITFASMIWRDSLIGAQFHPEKSQQAGLTILHNFLEL